MASVSAELEAGVLGDGCGLRAGPGAPVTGVSPAAHHSPVLPGPVVTGRSRIDRLRLGGPGCHLRDPEVLRRRLDPVRRLLLGC